MSRSVGSHAAEAARYFARRDAEIAASNGGDRRCGNCDNWKPRPAPAVNGICEIHGAILSPTQLIFCNEFTSAQRQRNLQWLTAIKADPTSRIGLFDPRFGLAR